MPKHIGIATHNDLKFNEFKAHLKRYGIRCVQVTDRLSWEASLADGSLIGVLSEYTELWSQSSGH